MSIGSVFVGIALLAVVAAYVTRPFRPAKRPGEVDRAIERWVAQIRESEQTEQEIAEPASQTMPVNYCSHCGRRVAADDRFCSGCGERLREES